MFKSAYNMQADTVLGALHTQPHLVQFSKYFYKVLRCSCFTEEKMRYRSKLSQEYTAINQELISGTVAV